MHCHPWSCDASRCGHGAGESKAQPTCQAEAYRGKICSGVKNQRFTDAAEIYSNFWESNPVPGDWNRKGSRHFNRLRWRSSQQIPAVSFSACSSPLALAHRRSEARLHLQVSVGGVRVSEGFLVIIG